MFKLRAADMAANLCVYWAAAITIGSAHGDTPAKGWDLSSFASCDTPDFQAFVSPLAAAARLTYTSSTGSSYFNPRDHNQTVPGFIRSGIKHDPPQGGMRALVFADERSGRLLVAYRGTDLDNSTVSGAADACANAVLFHDTPREQLPLFCAPFEDEAIDYYTRAVQFARQVERAYEQVGLQMLITGHSLGAGLAVLVAAALNEDLGRKRLVQVVAFAEPPVLQALRKRGHSSGLPSGSAFVLADANDPVQLAAADMGMVGTPCSWATGPPPPSCNSCDFASSTRSAACLECMLATHTLKHLLALLRGSRPTCSKGVAYSANGNILDVVVDNMVANDAAEPTDG